MTRPVIPALLATAMLTLASPVIAQEGSPLRCRGGGGMVATIYSGEIRITFTPTEVGTEAAPPETGSCGWPDRGFREGEPTMLLFEGDRDGIRALVDAMMSEDVFIVQAFDDTQGAMKVTRIGE